MTGTVRTWARMVKLSHSVFALPFAFAGAALAADRYGTQPAQWVWIAVAMVAARNAAMGFNRLADHRIDARNPRTASRELPAQALGRGAVWAFTLALAALFVIAAFQLHPLCGWLSPLALAIVLGYSYTKRFTWGSHAVLGLALAIAPVGGWLAIAGRFDGLAWLLAAVVLPWVAGFDVLYACQDAGFDRAHGLHSIPARFGVPAALATARVLHAASFAAMLAVGWAADLHPAYFAGVAVAGIIFVRQHAVVRADDLSRIGVAFLNMNGAISVLYLTSVLAALWFGRAGAGG